MEARKDLTHSNVYDLRMPQRFVEKKAPAPAPVKARDDGYDGSLSDFVGNTDPLQKMLTEAADRWEENPAYQKWLSKKDSYEKASEAMIIRQAQENSRFDPEDPEVSRYELRTISIGERLKNLQQIMRPYNGR